MGKENENTKEQVENVVTENETAESCESTGTENPETEKEPTVEEISKEIGISKEEIIYALDAIQNPMTGKLVYPPKGRHWSLGQPQMLDAMNEEDIESKNLKSLVQKIESYIDFL